MKGVSRRTVLAGASIGLLSSRLSAQQPVEVKVGLLVPIFGLYARPGTVMREGAEMAVDHINAQGGVKSFGGAKLKLVVQGRRLGAGMTIVQWQSGVPVTVFPPQLALAEPFWPKS